MQISKKAWQSYVNRLAAINKTAARKVDAYAAHVGLERAEEIVRYAYSVATQYGAMSASLACEMYDQLAAAQNVAVSPAVPAETATFEEAARATYGAIRDTPNRIGDPAGRFVKRSAADTMLQNAMRDGAEWAWIPQSTACAFCLTLASQGWQHASKAVMNGRHAKHIHNNCRCEFAVRFDGISDVEGYDPDALYDLYINAEGDTSRDRINFLRRELYADNMDVINAQNRTAYGVRNKVKSLRKSITIGDFETLKSLVGDTAENPKYHIADEIMDCISKRLREKDALNNFVAIKVKTLSTGVLFDTNMVQHGTWYNCELHINGAMLHGCSLEEIQEKLQKNTKTVCKNLEECVDHEIAHSEQAAKATVYVIQRLNETEGVAAISPVASKDMLETLAEVSVLREKGLYDKIVIPQEDRERINMAAKELNLW